MMPCMPSRCVACLVFRRGSPWASQCTGLRQDLGKVKPVPLQKTLLLVNNFVVNTTRFLNHFSAACEDRLLAVSALFLSMDTGPHAPATYGCRRGAGGRCSCSWCGQSVMLELCG